MISLLEKLLTLIAQFFIYRAGRNSVQQSQQQETLDDITIAKHVEADINRLDTAAVHQRLRDEWTRE